MKKEKYLVVNAGSSSLKFSLYEMPAQEELVNVYVEKIGSKDCFWTLKLNGEKIKKSAPLKDHSEAVEKMIQELIDNKLIEDINEIKGVGHRILHGGEFYSESVRIEDDVLRNIESIIDLGPLHLPPAIDVVKYMQTIMDKSIPQVAVFDTAFHQTMPRENYLYPVPYEWYEKYGVRRYAFHGISHQYITEYMQNYLGKKDVNLITCHLGNGSTVFSIKDGKCFDTSLSFSTNSGLVMGTRSGDIDPYIVPYMMKESGMTMEEVLNDLNKKSGLLGVSGVSSDSRDIEEGINAGNRRCELAQKLFVNRVVGYIAKLWCPLDGCDAICFAGGIGENSIMTRKQIIEGLTSLGIELDEEANDVRGEFRLITKEGSKIPCYIVPTDEELMIARDTYRLIG